MTPLTRAEFERAKALIAKRDEWMSKSNSLMRIHELVATAALEGALAWIEQAAPLLEAFRDHTERDEWLDQIDALLSALPDGASP